MLPVVYTDMSHEAISSEGTITAHEESRIPVSLHPHGGAQCVLLQ
jgi:hypothetical protein